MESNLNQGSPPSTARHDEAGRLVPEYVVGIGASAGGLEALERLFAKMPADSGVAFVVVQHLSPDFKSHMDDLLRRVTDIPVVLVDDGVTVEPNHIYLMPAKKEMIVTDGRLLLTDKDPDRGLTMPIDSFLRSLAQDAGRRAVAVILSGTGSDGSRGIEYVKEAGGLVLAQSEETAKFDGMPTSAVRTGSVDMVLAPDAMPETLQQYVGGSLSPDRLREQDTDIPEDDHAERILHVLRKEYGLDFSLYKPSTVVRRTERRMAMVEGRTMEQYTELVEGDPDELDALYRDLLIGVTSFFRDLQSFEALQEQAIPEIVSTANPHEEVRVWVAGCATGEEAYSVAMAFHDEFERQNRSPNLKIFATDVHKGSLDFASAGLYTEDRLEGVDRERLAKYFVATPDGHRVNPTLRKSVVFAPHNVVSDAPFTKLDLVTCRNLLIYLQPAAQAKVLSLFHFALRKGGFLFLGSSESPGDLEDEFARIDAPSRLYKKRRDVRLPPDTRFPLSTTPTIRTRPSALPGWARDLSEGGLLKVYDAILDRATTAGLLLDEQHRLLHSFGGAERYLRIRGGRPPESALQMLDESLRTAVTGAIQHARKENKVVRYTGVRASAGDEREEVTLTVEPISIGEDRPGYTLVSLAPVETRPPSSTDESSYDVDQMTRAQIAGLEGELRFAKENLQATIEELETSNEELQATNEELVASNEEMQSTNEELHSVNEELYTVNGEHQRKIAELTALTEDFDNLLASTDVGVIFLDEELCIRKFTPGIAEQFNLLPADVGRPIMAFAHSFDAPDLVQDVRRVLASVEPVQKEISDSDGQPYFLRIHPFRGSSSGVVLTLIDIGELRAAESERREAERRYRDLFENAPDLYLTVDAATRKVLECNGTTCETLGVDHDEVVGRPFELLFAEGERESAATILEAIEHDGEAAANEMRMLAANGQVVVVNARGTGVRSGDGPVTRMRLVLRDVTVETKRERQLRRSDARNAAVLEAALDAIVTVDSLGRIIEFNPAAERVFGYSADYAIGESLPELLMPESVRRQFEEGLAKFHDTGEAPVLEDRLYVNAVRADGTEFPIELTVTKIDVAGPPTFTGFVRDLTEQRHAEAIAERIERTFRATFENAAVGISLMDLKGNWLRVNDRLCEIVGRDRETLISRPSTEITHPEDASVSSEAIGRLLRENLDSVAVEKRFVRPDGEAVWISKTISIETDDSGEPDYVIAVVEDVTQRVRYEEDLREAIRARESFLAMLSHELRNPLSAVLSAARLLKRGFAKKTDFSPSDAADVVERQSLQMSRLLRDLLDVSRVTTGRLRLELEPQNFADVLREVPEAVRPLLLEHDVALDLDLPENPVWLLGDRTRLLQIAGNLVSNAAKYSPRETTVTMSLEESADEAVLRVVDEGYGIAPDDLERVFEPFVRVADRDEPSDADGLGVGLALVRSLVELHGGTVTANSRGSGHGCELVVRLPITDAPRPVAGDATPAEPRRPAPLRIAVVEDGEDNAVLLERHLQLDGHEVRLASTGEEGVSLVGDWGPDVVIADIGLPDIDGFEVARRIRESESGRRVRLIAVSGFGQPADVRRALEAGFDTHLTKPLDIEDLNTVLGEIEPISPRKV